MGAGTNGVGGASNPTRQLGVNGAAPMLKFGYDNGRYVLDSADQYGSHRHLREALKSVMRENVTILTKTNATTEVEVKSDIDASSAINRAMAVIDSAQSRRPKPSSPSPLKSAAAT